MAHRGNSSKYLENSYAAILSAASMGVGAVEFDVQHSKDGIAIIMHDSTLARTSEAITSECPLEKSISKLQAHVIERSCQLKNGEQIPTLDGLLERLSIFNTTLFIELKDMPKLADILSIETHYEGRADKIVFISFEANPLRQIRQWSVQFPFFQNVKLLKLNKWGKKDLGEFDGLDNMFISKKMIKKVRKAGKLTGTWTKDKASKIKKYFKRGINFVTSNNPQVCMNVLKRFKL